MINDILMQETELSVNYLESKKEEIFETIPELKNEDGFDQKNSWHIYDVWTHTEVALSNSNYDFEERLALLLHDIGKPFSYQDEEVRHFRGHAKVSSQMSRNILNRLNFDDDYIDKICYLIENHDTKITDEQIKDNYDLCLKLLEIQKSDALAHHPDKLDKRIDYLKETHKKLLTIKK